MRFIMSKLKYIIPVILTALVLTGASCLETEEKEKEIKEESKGGSCNSIELDSTCVDFIGPDWSESYCSEQGHVYSQDPCPQPTAGGCRLGKGKGLEKIVWSYDYGGSPLTWKSEIDDVLRPSCTYGPNSGEWIPGTIKLKD